MASLEWPYGRCAPVLHEAAAAAQMARCDTPADLLADVARQDAEIATQGYTVLATIDGGVG